MIEVDSRTIYIIGGLQNGSLSSPSNKIWTIDIISDNFSNEWNEGPSLNESRYRHACGIMNSNYHSNRPLLVVAGDGYKSEYLDFTMPESQWKPTSKSCIF